MRATRGFRPRMAKRVSYLSCRPCARFPYHACARVSCQPRARVVLPHTPGLARGWNDVATAFAMENPSASFSR